MNIKIKSNKNLAIAREKYNNPLSISKKLSFEKWVEYINIHQEYFTWEDDSADGIYRKNNIDKIPEWANEGILNSQKGKALAEFNKKKGWYEVVLSFHKDLGIITTTFQKKIEKKHLLHLLELANYLDALLLIDGKTVIDQQFIEELERKQERQELDLKLEH